MEIKYTIAWGTLVIAIITPAAQSTIRNAFKMLKKTITSKLAGTAAKIAAAYSKDFKSMRGEISSTVGKTLSAALSVHVYARSVKDEKEL